MTVSDTVLGLVYGAVALLTAKQLQGSDSDKWSALRLKPIVMLEEPEAHLYPIVFTYLANLIREASRESIVLVSTHSGLLAELLWERTGADIVYVARGRYNYTSLYRVDMDKILDFVNNLDDLITAHRACIEELIEAKALTPLGV